MKPLRTPALLVLLALQAAAQTTTAQGEHWSGFADVRNRFVQDVGGSFQTYRSVVNLGEGPRLYDAEMRYTKPGGRWADEFLVTGDAWGGDPYNTARLEANKAELYDFRLRYRNLAYFNDLPTFANPLLGEGMLLSQRALDITRRQIEADLSLRPRKMIEPFLGFYKADGFGRGRTIYQTDGNEFPVGTNLDDSLSSVRGGVKLNFSRWNVTLEQGRTGFADNQRVYYQGDPLSGNRSTLYLGRELTLNELQQRYDARGRGLFNRAVVQGRPHDRVSVSGQFLYSQPKIDATTQLDAQGSFILQSALAPYSGAYEQNLADANRPHVSGSWSTEWRATDRLRVSQSWYTDRYHVTSGSTLTQVLNTATETALQQASVNSLVFNYNQNQTDVSFDVAPQVTLRGGHRYVWGDARVPEATLVLTPEARNEGKIKRHVALAGAAARLWKGRLRLTGDFEASPGDRTFFRTGLMNYKKGNARARWKINDELSVHGAFSILDNKNDDPAVDLRFQTRRSSVTLSYAPDGGRLFTVLVDYTRATVRSDILAVQLPFFGTDFLRYRDNGHFAGAFVEANLPRTVHLRLGGSLAVNAGSRPTDFYQPEAALSAPITERIDWVSQWRWYGFGEQLFLRESFRTHTFSVGLRFGL
ncbi:MAG: hypothetical protein H6509_15880 [Bryobacterales bacterium]|nr:hypothetical protein [Bryobacterales bacterium]